MSSCKLIHFLQSLTNMPHSAGEGEDPLSTTTKWAKIEDDLVMLTTKVHKDKLVLLMYTFC